MLKRFAPLAIAAAVGAVASTAVNAIPLIYFGENTAACTTPGTRSTCTVSGAPLTAHNNFLSSLVGVGTETFEGYATGAGFQSTLGITFTGSNGNITADIVGPANGDTGVSNGGSNPFDGVSDDAVFGRWNTSPTSVNGEGKWYLGFDPFRVDFDQAISAFGFYGTDIGDVSSGQLTIALTAVDNTVTNLTVNNTTNGPNGSLLFWGFIDTTTQYKSISFGNTSGGFDGFGFDGMTIGDQGQVKLPEPGSIALVALSLVALGATKRRRR